jgi:hypothetical protein
MSFICSLLFTTGVMLRALCELVRCELRLGWVMVLPRARPPSSLLPRRLAVWGTALPHQVRPAPPIRHSPVSHSPASEAAQQRLSPPARGLHTRGGSVLELRVERPDRIIGEDRRSEWLFLATNPPQSAREDSLCLVVKNTLRATDGAAQPSRESSSPGVRLPSVRQCQLTPPGVRGPTSGSQ